MLNNRFGLDDDPLNDPLDPKRKIYDALAGPQQDDPTQATDPVGPRLETGYDGSGIGATGRPPAGGLVPDGAIAPTWSKGANAEKNTGMILGYDTGKLNDPGYESGKYNKRVRAFSGGLKQDVGVARGHLDNMLNYVKANGFPNARVVGDQKIDFGDGAGPIDVIRSDGQIVFQDPAGVEPGTNGATGTGASAGPLAGVPMDALLSGDPMAKIQALLAQLSGPRSNAQALLAALGGQ